MIPHILGSKPVVEAMEADLKPRVELLRQQGIVPKLAIVRVGANPDDLSYERMAIKRAESLDIAVQVFDYPENVDPELVAGDIRCINEDVYKRQLIDTMVDLERDIVIAFMVALEALGKFAEGLAREMGDSKTQEEGDTADGDDKEDVYKRQVL